MCILPPDSRISYRAFAHATCMWIIYLAAQTRANTTLGGLVGNQCGHGTSVAFAGYYDQQIGLHLQEVPPPFL